MPPNIAQNILIERHPQDMFSDVFEFHAKFGQVRHARPYIPTRATEDLRSKLVAEEARELIIEIGRKDLTGIADAIIDLLYVTMGVAVSYGIDPRPLWDAVHVANMRKEGGGKRDDGKVMKPSWWTPPDIAGLLQKQPALY